MGAALPKRCPLPQSYLGYETLIPPSFWRARVGNRGWDLWDGGRGTKRTNLVTTGRGRLATLPDRLRGDPAAFFTGSGRCEVRLSTSRGIPKSKKTLDMEMMSWEDFKSALFCHCPRRGRDRMYHFLCKTPSCGVVCARNESWEDAKFALFYQCPLRAKIECAIFVEKMAILVTLDMEMGRLENGLTVLR